MTDGAEKFSNEDHSKRSIGRSPTRCMDDQVKSDDVIQNKVIIDLSTVMVYSKLSRSSIRRRVSKIKVQSAYLRSPIQIQSKCC